MEYPHTKSQNQMEGYDPTDRDFQRTEDDVDNISASEKEALDERRKNKKSKKQAGNKQENKEKVT